MIYVEDGAIAAVALESERTDTQEGQPWLYLTLRVLRRYADSPLFGALPAVGETFEVSRRAGADALCGWRLYHDAPPLSWRRRRLAQHAQVLAHVAVDDHEAVRFAVHTERARGRTRRLGKRYVLRHRDGTRIGEPLLTLGAAKLRAQAEAAIAAGRYR